jgi:hypothetical protein
VKKYFLLVLLMIFVAGARAQVVNSCDGSYSVKVVARNVMVIEHAGKKIGSSKIDHGISGGVFDSADELLVVYGLPNKVDLRSPQAEYLSIYIMKPKLHMIMKRTYGGGVYDVAIGTDPDLVFVSSRFGFDIVNVKTMKIKSFDPMSEPQFSKQQCNFTPSAGIKAVVEVKGVDLVWKVSGENLREQGGVSLDTEKTPHIAVDSYDFSGRLGFSVWYVDDGMGTYTISRVFTFSPLTNKFVERFPSYGDEFNNLRVDKNRRRLISTYYDQNVPRLCTTRLPITK